MFGMLREPLQLLFFVPSFLIAITVHEVAHAYVAWRLGDPTARAMGRITLNPLRHIDPFGLILLFIIGFGWAKPVQINPRNFKNEKAGMAISALAGPVSNILLAFGGLIIFYIIVASYSGFIMIDGVVFRTQDASAFMRAALEFVTRFAMLNTWFAVFNLLPIPPLDGSRIINYYLPPRLSYYYGYVERYGFIILMALMITRILTVPIFFISGLISNGMHFILGGIFGIFM